MVRPTKKIVMGLPQNRQYGHPKLKKFDQKSVPNQCRSFILKSRTVKVATRAKMPSLKDSTLWALCKNFISQWFRSFSFFRQFPSRPGPGTVKYALFFLAGGYWPSTSELPQMVIGMFMDQDPDFLPGHLSKKIMDKVRLS